MLLFTIFSCDDLLYAQARTFQMTYGGTGNELATSIEETSDKGYIICGNTNSFGAGGDDIYVIKTDDKGVVEWEKTFGGTGTESGGSARQTSDGGYIIVGTTNSYGSGNNDIILIRTDASGNVLWEKVFGTTSSDEGNDVIQNADGGFTITGRSLSTGYSSVYLIRTDASGNQTWARRYGGAGTGNGWGSLAYSVRLTSDGGYIISVFSVWYKGSGWYDAHYIKTNSSGTIVWEKITSSGSGENGSVASGIVETSDGGYIAVTGGNVSTNGLTDFQFTRYNSSGTALWGRSVGTANYDYGAAVVQTADGGYVGAGYSTGTGFGGDDLVMVKLDGSGNFVWSRNYGGTGGDRTYRPNNLQETNDGGLVVAGVTASFGAGGNDIYVIKTDENGNSNCNDNAWSSTTLTGLSYSYRAGIQSTTSTTLSTTSSITSTNSASAGTRNQLCFTLPMELLDFSADWTNDQYEEVRIDWSTATESNVDHFDVERSEDGVNFTTIDQVHDVGNTTEVANYTRYDEQPYKEDISFYRIQAIDVDGSKQASHIEAVNVPEGLHFIKLFPNPSLDFLKIGFTSYIETTINVKITNLLGQVVKMIQPQNARKGYNEWTFKVDELSGGNYVIELSTSQQKYAVHQRFVVSDK